MVQVLLYFVARGTFCTEIFLNVFNSLCNRPTERVHRGSKWVMLNLVKEWQYCCTRKWIINPPFTNDDRLK